MFDDTIYALSSGSGICAISLIRLSGDLVKTILKDGFTKDLSTITPRMSTMAHPVYDGSIIDDVLVTYFKAPQSYTGEDVLEICCHGSPLIRSKLYLWAQHHGARLARNGEFSQRAVLNGKMSLSQAEGINDMIHARNNSGLTIAYHSAHGSVDALVQPLYEKALLIQAHLNVNIDYPEYEDIQQLSHDTLIPLVESLHQDIDHLITVSSRVMPIVRGINTVIVGKPNVGKSSLLNALLNEDKAIVSDIAGTTRDVVEGDIMVGSLPLHLLDTAGIREGAGTIETLGIEKSRALIEKSDLVIALVAEADGITHDDQLILDLVKDHDPIIVNNKAELKSSERYINISAHHNAIEPLVQAIQQRFDTVDATMYDHTLTNTRQLSLARQANDLLTETLDQLHRSEPLDLIEINLGEIIRYLAEIMGRNYSDDLLDTIFKNFCVGK